jgi:hypothetical protein
MSRRDSEVALRQMLDHAREAMILSKGKSAQELVVSFKEDLGIKFE